MRTEKNWEKRILPILINENFPLRLQQDIVKYWQLYTFKTILSTYIYGMVGSGKTIMAACMLLTEEKRLYLQTDKTQGLDENCFFVKISEFFFEIKRRYQTKESINDLLEKYSKAHLLVLDDLGIEKVADWTWDILYLLIDRRYENMKKTIITTNISLAEMADRMGDDRIPSRISRFCKIIKLKGSYTNN